jgi:hypothetical protein
MAKQDGMFPLKGSIDNLTFSKGPFGYLATRKSGPTRKQVLKGVNFERTRENAADFKTAVRAATLVRRPLGPILRGSTNVWLNGRMNRLLLQAIRSDKTHSRGKRAMQPGALSIMKEFEINHQNTFSRRKGVPYKTKRNTRNGVIQISVPSFIPKTALTAPDGATHFKIVSISAVIDFNKNTWSNTIEESSLIAISRRRTKPLSLQHPITVKAGEAQLQAVGILFYKLIDGLEKLLKGGAGKIVEAGEG